MSHVAAVGPMGRSAADVRTALIATAGPDGPRRHDGLSFWPAQASLPGLPAVAAPVGQTTDGLPVGAQLIGPLHEDDTVLTFAELLSDVTGGFIAPAIG